MNDKDQEKKKLYVLVEFPYPSGSGLHMGHAFSFTGGDIYARFKRMQGYEVLFPMGWDAFGLPTENYAIKVGRKPQEISKENTDNFRSEMKKLAFSFDWEREINTSDPDYYKWTQWIFVQLFKKGLAYKQKMPINWCPKCKIGLANEEVIGDKCERCGAKVGRRNISQWVVKITKYADRLIEGLKQTDFIDKVKAAQVNWIDRKEWIDITYPIEGTEETVTVATTRPDTNFGATFVVLAPEHELVTKLISNKIKTNQEINKIKEYVIRAKNRSELERQKEAAGREKTGVFTGFYAINQLTNKRMPVWITDFVLSSVGTGAVVGVPGHDSKDYEFAKQFGLEVARVVVGKDGDKSEIVNRRQVNEEEGKMINSGFLDGMDIQAASKKMMDYLEEKGWGKRSVRYHLRDWIFSRQHYWGEPIPMIFCANCAKSQNQKAKSKDQNEDGTAGWIPVPEEQLPVVLPEVERYEPSDTGESPLAKMTEWVKTECPVCGGEAKRETDTMPNWAGSDWYYLRYIDAHNSSKLGDFDLLKKWLPVDVYIGGDEHNTLHLLYSRFIHQFLYDLGVVPTEEPYYRRLSHGVILGPDGQRMSKSQGNIVVPGKITDKYGVDVLRVYLMFMGPFEATMIWDEKTLSGVKRFLERIEDLLSHFIDLNKQFVEHTDSIKFLEVLNKTILKITEDIDNFGFNTAIAKLMELGNYLQSERNNPKNALIESGEKEKRLWAISNESIRKIIKLIAPMAPYLAEELWKAAGESGSVHEADWPKADLKFLVQETITIPVAVNGKVRDQLTMVNDKRQMREEVIRQAKDLEKIKKWLEGKEVIRKIYIVGKMINLVVRD